MNQKILGIGIVLTTLFYTSQVYSQYSGGNGSQANPYQIANLSDLQTLSSTASDWDKTFIQTANIDAAATINWNSGQGFSPIGNSSTLFTGTYDGQGFSISNIFINRPNTNFIGFFGRLSNSEILNLGLKDLQVSGSENVGGLIGFAIQSVMENCYTTGQVNGFSNVGGFIGTNSADATVSSCFSSANVNSSSYQGGGFVGLHLGFIDNCYSRGNVTGGEDIGGFAGAAGGFGNPTQLENVYSTGSVNGSFGLGGIIGWVSAFTATHCFWDLNASAIADASFYASTIAGITGLNTINMKLQSSFTSWDFSTIWDINSCINEGYPFLRDATSEDPTPAPTGQQEQIFCSFATVNDLEVTGTDITWYDSNEVVLNFSEALVSGQYFASQTIGSCESTQFLVVNVTVSSETTNTTTLSECNSYTWAENEETYFTSGTYAVVNGCVTEELVLTINEVADITTTVTDETILANNSNATYQWVDCDNAFEPIPGATNQSFTALANGSYAVEITENGCTEVSNCVSISSLSLTDFASNSVFNIYPNPANNTCNIVLSQTMPVTVYSITGEVLMLLTDSNFYVVNVSNLSSGVYFVKAAENTQRLLIQ